MTRLLVLAFLLVAGLTMPAAAQTPLSPDDRSAIVATISGQIAAFQADDAELAFSFSSPDIRRIFRNPGRFMRMVQRGFEPIYRPQRVEFLNPVMTRTGWVQPVFVIGPEGLPVIADFSMQIQPDGSWKIHGCHLRSGGYQEV